jgi:hypothetical protein
MFFSLSTAIAISPPDDDKNDDDYDNDTDSPPWLVPQVRDKNFLR